MPKKNFRFGQLFNKSIAIGGGSLILLVIVGVIAFVLFNNNDTTTSTKQPALTRVPVAQAHTGVKYITNTTTTKITNDSFSGGWNSDGGKRVGTTGFLLGTRGAPPDYVATTNTANVNTAMMSIKYPINGDKFYQISMDINTTNGTQGIVTSSTMRIIGWDSAFYSDDLKNMGGSNYDIIGILVGVNYNYTFNVKKPTGSSFILAFGLANITDKILINNVSITQLN